MANQKTVTRNTCIVGLCVAINLVGSKLAYYAHIPIYLDSIGTILGSALLGPFWGILASTVAGLVSGVLGDMYAIYFLPGAMFTGLFAGLVLHNKKNTISNSFWKSAIISVPCSIVIAIINYYMFRGVSSSSSSIIVQVLSHIGMPLSWSVMIVQLITEYLDKLLAVVLVVLSMPKIRRSIHI